MSTWSVGGPWLCWTPLAHEAKKGLSWWTSTLLSFWTSNMNFYIVELLWGLHGLYSTHPLKSILTVTPSWLRVLQHNNYTDHPTHCELQESSHYHMVLNCACMLWAWWGRPSTSVYNYFWWERLKFICAYPRFMPSHTFSDWQERTGAYGD